MTPGSGLGLNLTSSARAGRQPACNGAREVAVASIDARLKPGVGEPESPCA